jgi:superfamily II DNA helicase RecQ
MQQKIIRLMFDPDKPNAVLAVYRTGEGKSHVIRMVGVLDRGVCLIFIPLLTLSADVMSKFQSACQLYGSVRAYHLDEIYDNNRDIYNAVLQRCIDLPPSTPSTVFVFLSPQHICRSSNACNTFIACAAKGTLRTVVMDEIHLHVAHGLSFREECRQLKDNFFIPVFRPRDKNQLKPRLLCLTATFPKEYYDGLEYLTAT